MPATAPAARNNAPKWSTTSHRATTRGAATAYQLTLKRRTASANFFFSPTPKATRRKKCQSPGMKNCASREIFILASDTALCELFVGGLAPAGLADDATVERSFRGLAKSTRKSTR